MSAAGGIDRLPFATTSTEEVLKAYNAAKGGKVVVMKKFDEKKAVLEVTSSTTAVRRKICVRMCKKCGCGCANRLPACGGAGRAFCDKCGNCKSGAHIYMPRLRRLCSLAHHTRPSLRPSFLLQTFLCFPDKPYHSHSLALLVVAADVPPQEEIADFVEAASMRLVTTFSPATSSAIFGGKIKVHMLYMADDSKDGFKDELDTLTKVASKNKGKLLHVHVPHTEERVLSYFGAKEDNLPMVVIADMTTNNIKKYT